MKSGLAGAVNDAVVRRLAGDRFFARGHEYFQQGQVVSLESDEESLRAVVRGGEDYAVTLRADDGILDYICSCPQGGTGDFCKHCVAAALAWLDQARPSAKKKGPRKPKKMTLADAAKILEDEEPGALLALILGWAGEDAPLRERILLHAARRSDPATALAEAERTFRSAVRVRGFLEYRAVSAWARNVNRAIDNFEQLFADGHAAALIPACESALGGLRAAVERIDDSAGHFTILSERLQRLHLAACEEAKPEPVNLAQRLFEWDMHGGFDIFHRAAETYAEILGERGLAEYRRLTAEDWAKVPVRGPADERSEWGRYFNITSVMEALAVASGDPEELIEVLKRDLSSPYQHLRVAKEYAALGRHEEALQWVEEGLRAFPRPDPRLREFAAGEYHHLGRSDEALRIIFAQFQDTPSLPSYLSLRNHAERTGAWTEWRDKAMAEVRRRVYAARASHGRRVDHSLLVEILLEEGDTGAAWQEAQAGGCAPHLWLQLAAARAEDHPADAAAVYLQRGEMAVAEVRDGRYGEAVELLEKAAALMRRLGRREEFIRDLERLRETYRIKRNFTKLLDERRASLYFA